MPTVFDRISGALDGNTVSVHVSEQAETLGKVAATVAGLIEHPPKNVGDLGSALQTLPLPKIEVGGEFAKTLQSLSSAVPHDLSSVTGDLTSGLDSLVGQLGGIAGPLGKVLEMALAIYQATQVDLMCLGAATETAATVGAGAPPAPPLPSPFTGLSDILDQLPSPMSVTGLLSWLDQLLHNLDTSSFQLVEIPFFDSLRYPLITLTNWRHMPPPDILDNVAATLDDLEALLLASADVPLGALETAVSAFDSQLPASTLADVATQLATQLGVLRTAIQAKTLDVTDAAVAAINAQLDSYSDVQQDIRTFAPLNRVPSLAAPSLAAPNLTALRDLLPKLTRQLEDGLGRVSSLLQVDSPLSFIPSAPAEIPEATLGDITGFIAMISDRLQSLIDRLDLSVLKGPLTTVAQAMQDAVDGIDAAQVKVALQVQSLFADIEKLVAQVDIAGLVSKVQAAIDNFQKSLVTQLQGLFQPVRDALAKILTDIDKGVSSFDPASLVNSLRDAAGKLSDVLKSPEVASAMNDIRSTIEETAKALESLSFAPLTDQVIADIKQLTDSLKKIDTSQLSTPLQLALQTALAILPPDLKPFSDPLEAELRKLVEEGPAPMLATLQKQPQILLDQVKKFEPAALLGDTLSKPFLGLIQQMEAFKPSKLLDPVQGELELLKSRLRQSANPGLLLQPLETLFGQVLQAFDRLHPEALVEPLNQAIHKVIDGVLQALPIDDTFQQIDRVLDSIKQVAGAGDRAIALLQRIMDMLNGLANPQQQMEAWMTDTLANLNAIADTSSLQTKLDAVSLALKNTHAAALTSRFDAATNPLLSKLETLDPQAKLVAIIQAYNGVSKTELAGLPDSPQKAAITQVLNRFNPVDPAFGAPFSAAEQARSLLEQAKSNLAAAMTDWDDRFHTDGMLAELLNLQASPANLRDWVAQSLDAAFSRPITSILAMAAPLGMTLQPIFNKLKSLVDLLDSKLSVLLQGPDSLTGIRDKMKALVQKLQGLNLNFITDSLKILFAQLRDKLEAISPAQLHKAIDNAFNAMLDSLKVTLLISAADVAKLDGDYQAIVKKLKQLDPGKLVTSVVQPEFDKTIQPLLKIFDPSDLLKALFDQFTGLDEKLKAEITRVNQAYQDLRNAVPPISISLGDVSLPF